MSYHKHLRKCKIDTANHTLSHKTSRKISPLFFTNILQSDIGVLSTDSLQGGNKLESDITIQNSDTVLLFPQL